MATLDSLKHALRHEVSTTASSPELPLSDTQYSVAFEIFTQYPGCTIYQDFIVPELSQLLTSLLDSRIEISVLEIGPGPKSVLGLLPGHLRRKIRKYTAFEPNGLYADKLEEWFYHTSPESSILNLSDPPDIRRCPFLLEGKRGNDSDEGADIYESKFDVILFCHSMYGMKYKHKFIEKALEMVTEPPQDGVVIVFHRDRLPHLNGLVCHRTANHPNGKVRVADNDNQLDLFASFIAGKVTSDKAVRVKWREVCRTLGHREEATSNFLQFRSPEIMLAFTRHASTLPELVDQVPQVQDVKKIKNREAQSHHPACILRPTEIQHIQQCIRWALKHKVGLTVIGGGHSGHCIWSSVVSIDMSAFNDVHVLVKGKKGENSADPGSLVFVGAGSKVGDIVRKTMAMDVTVPLGARPSVGAGLWLQGGIGHLSRLYGLASDAIIGAVIISVDSGRVLCIGHVPEQHWPAGAIRPENELDLLWAIKGAGTNFGIVVGVIFKAFPAPIYRTQNWIIPLEDRSEARQRLSDFDKLVSSRLPSNCSADVYLYWDTGRLHLAINVIEVIIPGDDYETRRTYLETLWGPSKDITVANGIELFDGDMYMSQLHGGHAGGKTSSFKRCLFLKLIGQENIIDRLIAAVEKRPSLQCYLHLLHGGGAVREVGTDTTAFGCRDWDFACVITGIWPRDLDETELADSTVQWVYDVAEGLLSVCSGAYSADLGPDPRDAPLAKKAFGPNLSRLARLKHSIDPHGVLSYACRIPQLKALRLIILVTGESCSGKDYCADIWASVFARQLHGNLRARVVSISESTKREYAAATGADLSRLFNDRAYKEFHRPALTAFFKEQELRRPGLSNEHFQKVVYEAGDVDILLITGMREKAPKARISHLVPGSRLLEINVRASERTRQIRRGCPNGDGNVNDNNDVSSNPMRSAYHPGLIFSNDRTGNEEAEMFAKRHLLPFFHQDLQQLAGFVRLVPNFPYSGLQFRHVLGISQRPGGLSLCTSLLESHFTGDWSNVDAIASCESGGFVYASALAARVNVPMIAIREAGKLPPPTVSVVKSPSYITSSATSNPKEVRIEMERDAVAKGSSVVIVDDVLSTGETLCAVLQLLRKAEICVEDISIIVVAEFPIHRGRGRLCQRGFAGTNVQSLLIFDGA